MTMMVDANLDPRLQSTAERSSAPSNSQHAWNSQKHPYSPRFAHQAHEQPPSATNTATNNAAPRPYRHPQLPHQPADPLSPSTPQSANTTGTHDTSPIVGMGLGPYPAKAVEASEEKRPRACEKCRELKVKCIFEKSDGSDPCNRCQKANRQCIVTEPVRKRQKKDPEASSSKVLELERKIDALTAALSGRDGRVGGGNTSYGQAAYMQQYGYERQVPSSDFGNEFSHRERPMSDRVDEARPEPRKAAPSSTPATGTKRAYDAMEHSTDAKASFLGDVNIDSGNNSRRSSHHGEGQPKNHLSQGYTDVIDRGVVSMEAAEVLFRCYVEQMSIHMPAVVFPAGTTAADIRTEKPVLFLAILSASCGPVYPEMQKALTQEVMGIYADRIICQGYKSLELIQGFLVNTLWYFPPDHFEELNFFQLIHIAAVMAIDIGLGQKSKVHILPKTHPWRRVPHPDSESLESRRTWLACYFLCCNASIALRRPNLIRWTPFMAESVQLLKTSPDAEPHDKVLALWAENQHIAEEIGTQFAMDDPAANVSISEPKVQYALKGFEKDLHKWRAQIPMNTETPCLTMLDHVVNLYMHEVAMHVDHNVDEFKPPFTEASLQGVKVPEIVSPVHIEALSTCLKSIDGVFTAFLGLEIAVVRCLPVALFVRVAYAIVVLLKMYFAAALPYSELGKIINRKDMKVEEYLENLVKLFTASAEDHKSRPANKFLRVLVMLKTWFYKKRDGMATMATSSEVVGGSHEKTRETRIEGGSMTTTSQPSYSPANTGLRMLSEVATGKSSRSSDRHSHDHAPHHPHGVWHQPSGQQQQQQQQPQQYGYDVQMHQMLPSANYADNHGYSVSDMTQYQGMNLGLMTADGFEQAIGMTMGFTDFANYFGPGGPFSGAGGFQGGM